MPDFDIMKLQNIKLDPQQFRVGQDVVDRMNRQAQEISAQIDAAREEKEAVERRKHTELIAAIKEAGDKGATILIGDNANGVQILQNSPNAVQTVNSNSALDFVKVCSVLEEIKGYFDLPQFQQTFGDNSNNVKTVIEETLAATADSKNEGLIKKSLHVLRDLAIGASGSLIASGILALLGTLPI